MIESRFGQETYDLSIWHFLERVMVGVFFHGFLVSSQTSLGDSCGQLINNDFDFEKISELFLCTMGWN